MRTVILAAAALTMWVAPATAQNQGGPVKSQTISKSATGTITDEDKAKLEILSKEIESDKSNISPYLERASLLWDAGNRDGANADLASARMIDAYLADTHAGTLYYFSRELKSADRFLSAAIDAKPEEIRPRYFRAALSIEQRKFDRALEDLESALKNSSPQSPDSDECAFLRAKVFFELGRFNEAVDSATDALSRRTAMNNDDKKLGIPNSYVNPQFYFVRGAANARLKKYDLAIADFDACESAGGLWPDLYEQRADCFRALKETARELADRMRARELRQSPKSTPIDAK